MKTNGLLLFLYWIIFGIGLTYIGEYIISRPVDEWIQLLCIIMGFILAVALVKKTANFINNYLKND